jgi:hypothetical protein
MSGLSPTAAVQELDANGSCGSKAAVRRIFANVSYPYGAVAGLTRYE